MQYNFALGVDGDLKTDTILSVASGGSPGTMTNNIYFSSFTNRFNQISEAINIRLIEIGAVGGESGNLVASP